MLARIARKLQYLAHTAVINIETVQSRGFRTLKDIGEIRGRYAACCCENIDVEEAFEFLEPIPPLLRCLRFSAFFGNERKRLVEIITSETERYLRGKDACSAKTLEISLRPYLKRPAMVIKTLDGESRAGKSFRLAAPAQAIELINAAINRHNTVLRANFDVTAEDVCEICDTACNLHAKIISNLYGVESGLANNQDFRLAKEAAAATRNLLKNYKSTLEFMSPAKIQETEHLCSKMIALLDDF